MATQTLRANSPDYECLAYKRMRPAIEIMQDIWRGNDEIKRKRTKYLWKTHDGELNTDYNRRLKASYFYNVTGRTISGIVGLVCKHDIVPQQAPTPIKELFTDIDLCGNDLDSFLREAFTNAVRDGHSFIFVDAPPPLQKSETPDGDSLPPVTLADVSDRRPFCINYRADQAINWQYEIVDGRLVLTQITFRETTTESDGSKFGETEVIRYRVLQRGSYSLYRKDGRSSNLITEVENALTGLPEIPLAVIYGKRVAPLESIPPLRDIADLNIAHYNEKSDLKSWAHVACVPLRTLQFDRQEDAEKYAKEGVAASVHSAILGWGENFNHYFVEVSGSGIDLAKELANETVSDMSKLGLNMFEPKPKNVEQTAFEVASANTNDYSDVAVMARNLENAFEQVTYFLGEYLNAIRGAGTVKLTDAERNQMRLKINYDKLTFSLAQLAFFHSLRKSGELSKLTFLEILFNYADMPKDVTAEKEQQRQKDELETFGVVGMSPTNGNGTKTTLQVSANSTNPDNEVFGV